MKEMLRVFRMKDKEQRRAQIAKIKWKKVNGEMDSESEEIQLNQIYDGDL